jgi:rare lipoprotein A
MALILPMLWSCSSAPILDNEDGAPDRVVDVSTIPNAVPRVEPRSSYGNPSSYAVNGHVYHVLASSKGYVARGIASWYGTKFHGRLTSSGEPYNMYAMTAAHRTLPLPTFVRVTNLRNGRSVVVKVNDRGPFVKNRLIDLSYVAARKLGVVAAGTAPVEIRAIDPRHPQPVLARATNTDSAAHATRLYVQVGAFINRFNAERLRTRLQQLPVHPVHIEQAVSEQRTVYRVRIGPLGSVAAADHMTELLAHHGMGNSRIVVD